MSSLTKTIEDGRAVYDALEDDAISRVVVESMQDSLETATDPKIRKALRRVHNYYCYPQERIPKEK